MRMIFMMMSSKMKKKLNLLLIKKLILLLRHHQQKLQLKFKNPHQEKHQPQMMILKIMATMMMRMKRKKKLLSQKLRFHFKLLHQLIPYLHNLWVCLDSLVQVEVCFLQTFLTQADSSSYQILQGVSQPNFQINPSLSHGNQKIK